MRVSFGPDNTLDEVDDLLALLAAEVARLRALAPAVAS